LRTASSIPLFLLADTSLEFEQNSYEKLENLPSNRKIGIKIQKMMVHILPLFKTFCLFKRFGAKQRISKFNSEGRVKKY
jgi:hypothetical protein